jgi:hypothetical protein
MRAIINGKAVVLPDDVTVSEARRSLGEALASDQFVEEKDGQARPLDESEKIKEGSRVFTIPKIVKG